MAFIITGKGLLKFENRILYFDKSRINEKTMTDSLKVLSFYLDKTGINWGPAFGTLIGVVRNDGYLPWASCFDLYILKEDEERFKDVLWALMDVGFSLARYERRGLYYLCRGEDYFKVFVLHKISSNVRHTGGVDFIHEKYLQNTVKWDFKGIELNVPSDVDDYLTFQYGDWVIPKKTINAKRNRFIRYYHCFKTWLMDHSPDSFYYYWWKNQRKKDFEKFKKKCEQYNCPLPENVELTSMRPRKYKKVLTVGVYDLLHKGHVELYRRAKALGDYLIVAVQDGDFILKYKPNSKVLNSTEDRKYMIKSIRYVDEVITYYDVDEIVKNVDFDLFVTGADQCHSGFQRAIQWCEEHGKEHVVLGRTDGISSSELKEKIAAKTGKTI